MKIFISIEQYEYEPAKILGVYSTAEKAHQRVDKEKQIADKLDVEEKRIMFFVQEFTLDS